MSGSTKDRQTPFCIFCGGQTKACTQDHVPAKVFFRNKVWPEGHLFPACKQCNDATRKDEQLLAFVARFGHGPNEDEDFEEWRKMNLDISRYQRDVWQNLVMRPIEKRRALEVLGIERPDGMFLDDIPIVKISSNIIGRSMNRIGFKIGASLHFLHTNKMIHHNGGCFISFRLNSQGLHDVLDPPELGVYFKEGTVRRDKVDLASQFWYKFCATEDGVGSVSNVLFRSSFSMSIIVVADKMEAMRQASFPEGFWTDIVAPFNWH
jgi:hypothetical protein